jgi:hypothetical protein
MRHGPRTSPEAVTLDGGPPLRPEPITKGHGISLHDLRACERHARDGTDLPNCVKVYLPPPVGPFGAVFRLKMLPEGLRLVYLAFGTRHHPHGSRAPTVYELAHQRLHGRPSAT